MAKKLKSTSDNKSKVSELEKQVKSLEKQLAEAKTGKIGRFFKKLAVGLLVFVCALSLNLSVVSLWLKTNILDTDTWVTKTSELIEDPAIRQSVSNGLANQIFLQANVESYVAQVLPEQISGLSGSIADGMQNFTAGKINEVFQTDEFLQFWANANRSAHSGIVDSLKNGGNVPEESRNNYVVYLADNQVVLNLKPVFLRIKDRLVERGLGFLDRFSGERINGTLTLTEVKNMNQALKVFNVMNKAAVLFPVFAILSGLGAIALAASKRRTLMSIAIVTALLMVANVQLIYLAKYPIINSFSQALASSTTEAATNMFDILTGDLVTMSRTLMAAAILTIFGTFITGQTKIALAVRRGTANLFNFKKSKSKTLDFIAKNANGVVGSIGGITVLLLVLPIADGPVFALIVIGLAIVLSFLVLSVKQARTDL